VHLLAERLLKKIRNKEFIRAGDRLAVAVSAGADSVALLCLLLELRAELGVVLSVAHVNHKLRGEESNADERFVTELAQRHGLELHVCKAPESCKKTSGVEAAARHLRYDFFRQLARDGRVTKIATAHTLDDQAETVLLRLFRGTGIRGLAGIHPQIILEEQGRAFGEVIRPLLEMRRGALQEFLRLSGQDWREDSSNRDVAFLRNRVRRRLLPIIAEEFGDAALEHMSDLAEIARAEEEHWEREHPEADTLQAAPLPIKPLLSLSLAAQRRLVRAWLETNVSSLGISFRMIEESLELAHGPANKKLELPAGRSLRIVRQSPALQLELQLKTRNVCAHDYEYALSVPGSVEVPELGACIDAQLADAGRISEEERGHLLDPARVPKQVLIRNWRAGDRYWPAHTAAAKKVKDLLSDRHATGTEKKLWPVAVADGCGLIWMRGFAVPAAFQSPPAASQAICIRERRA
jgi:tRNA(Ile)-lysidine synthase